MADEAKQTPEALGAELQPQLAEGASADAPVELEVEAESSQDEAKGGAHEPKDEPMDEPKDEDEDDVVEVEGPDAAARAEREALERELQCALCCDLLFKPVSVSCGHSFCRVCLMRALLSRPIDEAQCPSCRAAMLTAAPSRILSVNVTLWNIIQMVLPSHRRIRRLESNEEDEEYALQIDQADAKWRIHALTHRADEFHREGGEHSDQVDSEDEGEEADTRRQRRLYPEIKVETAVDGRLMLSRNVILDTTDHNEDGYASMRVALAIVEFPSIMELYNEHQECSVAVVKLEEDEELDGSAPFFLDENGDDDLLVLPNYFNEITLSIHDESGNCVMERTRGATRGTVTFPDLRLDVPGGSYTFTFKDDLYGVELSVTTELREPHGEHDAPLPEYIRLVNDEAGDGSRGRRRRHQHEEDEDDEDDGEHSDDSFIVNDEEDADTRMVAAFSGDEDDNDDGEGEWVYSSDDEENDENRERQRVERNRRKKERRRQRREQQSRVVEVVDDDDEDLDHDEHEPVIPRRNQRRNANQIVDSEDEHHDEEQKEENDEGDERDHSNEGNAAIKGKRSEREEDDDDDNAVQRPTKRSRPVFASDDSEHDDHHSEDDNVYERTVEHFEEDFHDEGDANGEPAHGTTDYEEDHDNFSDDNDGREVHADGDDYEVEGSREGQIYGEEDYEEEEDIHREEIEGEFPDDPDDYVEDQYDDGRGDEHEFDEE